MVELAGSCMWQPLVRTQVSMSRMSPLAGRAAATLSDPARLHGQVIRYGSDFSPQLLKESASTFARWSPVWQPSTALRAAYDNILVASRGALSPAVSSPLCKSSHERVERRRVWLSVCLAFDGLQCTVGVMMGTASLQDVDLRGQWC